MTPSKTYASSLESSSNMAQLKRCRWTELTEMAPPLISHKSMFTKSRLLPTGMICSVLKVSPQPSVFTSDLTLFPNTRLKTRQRTWWRSLWSQRLPLSDLASSDAFCGTLPLILPHTTLSLTFKISCIKTFAADVRLHPLVLMIWIKSADPWHTRLSHPRKLSSRP